MQQLRDEKKRLDQELKKMKEQAKKQVGTNSIVLLPILCGNYIEIH